MRYCAVHLVNYILILFKECFNEIQWRWGAFVASWSDLDVFEWPAWWWSQQERGFCMRGKEWTSSTCRRTWLDEHSFSFVQGTIRMKKNQQMSGWTLKWRRSPWLIQNEFYGKNYLTFINKNFKIPLGTNKVTFWRGFLSCVKNFFRSNDNP